MQTGFGRGGRVGSPLTPNGYYLDEVISALQKEIRRGKEYEAVYWAIELESFNPTALWNRMKVIASEDIGVAEHHAPLIIDALNSMYTYAKKNKKEEYRLFFVNAVSFLARAPKCRIADNLTITVYSDIRLGKRLEMPDYAIDKHTIRGKKMGRGLEHFFDEGAKLENKSIEDPYEKKAFEALKKKKKT